jgi:hypothetical protein
VNFTPWLLYPRERTLILIKEEVAWASGPIWTFWRREKSRIATAIRTPEVHPLAASRGGQKELYILCSVVEVRGKKAITSANLLNNEQLVIKQSVN